VKSKKPLPKNAILGLIVGGALLVALVGYMLLIRPQQAELKDVKAQIADVQNTITDYQQAAQQAKPTAVPKIKVADIYRLARAMPSDIDMPDVLIELNDVADASGVTIDSIAPQSPAAGNGFELQPLSLSCHGDFYSLTDFVYRIRTLVNVRHGQLEAGGRLFAIESIGFQPANTSSTPSSGAAAVSAGGAELQADIKLDTFVYGAAPAGTATPAAPVTPTTSTDTTATTTSSAPSASAEGAP
jgi:hypothetical protein